MRLNAYISKNTKLSRRKAVDVVKSGVVKVNKNICTDPATIISEKDIVKISNNVIKEIEEEDFRVYMFNKPVGVVCSNTRQYSETLIRDFFSQLNKVITAGRLDRETSGLIIVTNSGDIANKIAHPSSNIEKQYIVNTMQEICSSDLKNLSSGQTIQGACTRPVDVRKLKSGKTSITITEGKNREIRNLYETHRLDIIKLKRTRIGPLHLGKIPEGQYKLIDISIINSMLKI
ncbi:MAG: rRNA pseudouridine synthase [Chlamydiia bacterium]|nr:rRNA pseudouridine synthase [Chlamydiia bacterium]